jgi:hypothetical protein
MCSRSNQACLELKLSSSNSGASNPVAVLGLHTLVTWLRALAALLCREYIGRNAMELAFLIVALLVAGSQIPANDHIAFRR